MVVLVSFLIFVLLVLGLDRLPMQSALPVGLDEIGRTLTEAGAALGDILQLPVTVPLYVMVQNYPLALIQQEARHDSALWLVTWTIWAILGFLALGASRLAAEP